MNQRLSRRRHDVDRRNGRYHHQRYDNSDQDFLAHLNDKTPRTMMTSNPKMAAQPPRFFNFDAQAVRVVGDAGAPWFVAKDVCAVLDLTNTTEALRDLEPDEKALRIADTLGGPQELSVINESGLYALIFRSRKPRAKLFRRWVTNEVLPAVRSTGSYSAQPAVSDAEKLKQLVAEAAELVASLKRTRANRRPTRRDAAQPLLEVIKLEPMSPGVAWMKLESRCGRVPRATFWRWLKTLSHAGEIEKLSDGRWSSTTTTPESNERSTSSPMHQSQVLVGVPWDNAAHGKLPRQSPGPAT